MDLSVVFLGTGGSVPSARRATACVLIRAGGARILVDCGEGAQRQMINSTGLVHVDDIYITHFHADHYLGLPGLLKTYDLMERQAPLRIVGPTGLIGLFDALRRIFGRLRYEVELVELEPGEGVEHDGFEMRAFGVEHRMKALGYAYVEPDRPGRFDPDAAHGLGISDDRDFGRLQRGETVSVDGAEVRPEQVMGDPRLGRKLVITGDTSPCEMTRIAAHAAQLLVHDGTFAIEESARAAETGHSTGRDAAQLAAEAEVRMLAIVHVSSRYNVSAVLGEARDAFANTVAPRDFDLVEIPFPERGDPELIQEGAKQRREPLAEPATAGD
ncbi:MAG: ribonuclease [Solirubrobacterales bacterium]|jgi:ribonuclease Z|nr:ribonuclease [Solirubrobacterales bacterium]